MNTLRTGLLMAALTGLFLVVGFLVGGEAGMAIAFLFAAGTNLFAYWNSDRVLLSMYGARQIDDTRDPRVPHIVRQLASQAGLPMPKLFVVENDQPNAFATGRDPEHAALCVTSGLLARVNDEELAGVLAHELGHVKHRDTLTMTITATLAGAVSMLANFAFFLGGNGGRRDNPLGIVGVIVVSVLAPIAALLVQMAISRSREFEADREGAEISGRPLWLASALQRIDSAAQVIDNPQADANPATAHMFIVNPLHGNFAGLFASHPSTAERVARLKAMAGKMQAAARSLGVKEAQGLAARAAALAIISEVLHATASAGRGRRSRVGICRRAMPALRAPSPARRSAASDSSTRSSAASLRNCRRRIAQVRPSRSCSSAPASSCSSTWPRMPPSTRPTVSAQADGKAVHFKALINAVLRRVSREGKAVVAAQDAGRLDTPDWLWSRWTEFFGAETTHAIAMAHTHPAPIDIVLKSDATSDRRPEGTALFGGVVRLTSSAPIETLPGYDGAWWVQDIAATLPARLFGDVAAQAVIDLCAAPGGKTMQLAQMGARVTAVEREAMRLERVRGNLERVHLRGQAGERRRPRFQTGRARALRPSRRALHGHGHDPPPSRTTVDQERIRHHIVCGVVRGASRLRAADMTAAGGMLIYAVCSLEPEEGVEQIDGFLERNDAFARAPIAASDVFGRGELVTAAGDLRTLPCHLADKGGMDGFYAARLRRRSLGASLRPRGFKDARVRRRWRGRSCQYPR